MDGLTRCTDELLTIIVSNGIKLINFHISIIYIERFEVLQVIELEICIFYFNA